MSNPMEFGPETLGALRSRVDEAALKVLIPSLQTGTITMLFTDIVDSTPLKQGSPDAEERYFAEIKQPHDILLKSTIESFRGQILNLTGDAFFAGFQGARNAVRCAHAIQEALSRNPIQTSLGLLKVRIGVHTGEPAVYKNVLDNYDLYGSDVDKAWRIMSEARAEQVLLSPQTKTFAEALDGFNFHSYGRRFLKGLGWNEIFELLWNNRIPRGLLGSSHNQAPDPQSDFVGRTQELDTLRKSLGEYRLVTLAGSSGMGKTRMAWEISLHSADEPWAVQGSSFARLDQVAIDTEPAVHDALIASLNLDSAAAGGAKAALEAEFQAGPALLVLDNCEAAPQSIANIAGQLLATCPSLKILATSQRPLGLRSVEAVVNLGPMALPGGDGATVAALETIDSYQLFLAAARRARVGWRVPATKAATLSRLLKLTDGIPLAIELVAAAVPFSSLEGIADDLEATPLGQVTDAEVTFGSVAGPGPARHLSLLRCFQWSFNHLPDPERSLFAQLNVFAGSFTEAAARRVCALENARPLLVGLVRANLIHLLADVNPSRYFMLRIARVFARIKAAELGLEIELDARYVQFFHGLVTFLANADEVDESIIWEHDWPDLLAAAYKAQRLGNPQAVRQISRAVSPFLKQRGLWTERERLNRAAVVSAEEMGAGLPLARALVDLGIVLEALGRWGEAAAVFQRSLDAAQQDPNNRAIALGGLGRILGRLGRSEDAQRVLGDLQKMTPELTTSKTRSRSLDQEGHMLQNQGRLLDAERKYRESFALRRASHDAKGAAYSRSNLGVILTLRGEWQAAEAELRQSLLDWAALGSTKDQGVVLHHLGDLFRRQERYAEAQRYLQESVRMRDGNPKGQAVTLGILGRVFTNQGLWSNAENAFLRSVKISESLGDIPGLSHTYDLLGTAYMLQRRRDEAVGAFEKSLSLQRSNVLRDERGLAITLDRLAHVYRRSGNLEQARRLCEESVALSRRVGRGTQTAVALTNLARIWAAQGDKDAALHVLDEALDLFDTQKDNRQLLEAKRQRDRVGQLMRPGVPWAPWVDAAYIAQKIAIRRQFNLTSGKPVSNEAVAGCRRLIEEFIDSGQTMETAIALNELSSAYRRLAAPNYTEAEAAIRSALSIFDDLDLAIGKADAWHKRGNLCSDRGELENAENAYGESLRLKRELLDDEGEAITLDHLSEVYTAQSQCDRAEDCLERSREILRSIGTARQRWANAEKRISLKKLCDGVPAAVALARAVVEEFRGEDPRVSEEARALLSRLLADGHHEWNPPKRT